MFAIFSSVSAFLKLNKVSIDNNVFRLHYKATMVLLLIFSLMVSSNQFFGQPIKCIAGSSEPTKVIETFCWITSTFTVASKAGRLGVDVVAPGVATYRKNHDEVKHHKYYQWVCFCLFFQAILFYVPRYVWKIWEGGRIKKLAENLKFVSLQPDKMKDARTTRCNYFLRNLGHHNFYFAKFSICELLNLVNVMGQICLMDRFLGGEFSTYGSQVLNFVEEEFENRSDPMTLVFPKVTKCTFYKFGYSGTLVSKDALCILPLNIINEKIYVFLWFWFLALTAVSWMTVVYRAVTVFCPQLRYARMRLMFKDVGEENIETLCRKFVIGDWFVFDRLASNVDPFFMRELMIEMAETMRNGTKDKEVDLDV